MGSGKKEERTIVSFLFDCAIGGINAWDRARNSWAWLTLKAFVGPQKRSKTPRARVASYRAQPPRRPS